jgi:hypothetical protein
VKKSTDDFDVIRVHQCPCSLATNLLVLGVWMASQNVVEKCHSDRMKEMNVLSITVDRTWEDLDAIKPVHFLNRWQLVLDPIIGDKAGGRLVKFKKRSSSVPCWKRWRSRKFSMRKQHRRMQLTQRR